MIRCSLSSTFSSVKHILQDVNRNAQSRRCKQPFTPEFFWFFSLFFLCSVTGRLVFRCPIYRTRGVKGLIFCSLLRVYDHLKIDERVSIVRNFNWTTVQSWDQNLLNEMSDISSTTVPPTPQSQLNKGRGLHLYERHFSNYSSYSA